MDKFEIEVPIDFSGSGEMGTGKSKGSSNSKSADLTETNKLLKNLDKDLVNTLDWQEMLSMILGDLYKILSPLLRVLSLALLILFIPFIPLIKILVNQIATTIKGMMSFFKGDISLKRLIEEYIVPAGIQAIDGILSFVEAFLSEGLPIIIDGFNRFMAAVVLPLTVLFIEHLPQLIKALFEGIFQVLLDAWNLIIEKIKSFLGIKETKSGGSTYSNNSGVIMTATGPMSTAFPQQSVFGKGAVFGSSPANTVNIFNPVVKEKIDITNLSNQVSKVLANQTSSRFS